MEPKDLKVMSNGEQVTAWMRAVGQGVPSGYERPPYQVLQLRESLISEEYREVLQALADYRVVHLDGTSDVEQVSNLLKELSDLLVVVYGTFTALGINADDAFAIVMAENFGKKEHQITREDGKVLVPFDVKCELKKKTAKLMRELIAGPC